MSPSGVLKLPREGRSCCMWRKALNSTRTTSTGPLPASLPDLQLAAPRITHCALWASGMNYFSRRSSVPLSGWAIMCSAFVCQGRCLRWYSTFLSMLSISRLRASAKSHFLCFPLGDRERHPQAHCAWTIQSPYQGCLDHSWPAWGFLPSQVPLKGWVIRVQVQL